MRISKKILAVVLSALLACTMMPFAASADTIGIAPGQSMLDYDASDADELFESIEDADNVATIVFMDDIVVTEPVVIAADKKIKFNLNGHSLSGNIQDADGKKLIQVRGELEFIGSNGGCIYNTNTAGQGHAACQALTGGVIFVNSPIHFGDSDTDMTNANTTNRGCGIQNNGGTLIINDGYYTAIDADYTAGAWAYAILNCDGDTTVNNATVYGNALHGALGCEAGTLTVNDGSFAVNGANNYYSLYIDDGVATVNGGTFVNNGKYGVNYLGTGAETNINGGTFTYTVPFVVSGSKGNPVVSGGTFDNDVTAYLVDGATQDSTTGAIAQTYVAKIDGNYYEDLISAVNDAQAGDTVTLLSDVTISSTFNAINENITIDFGTFTLTDTVKWPFENHANITLKGTTGGIVSPRGVIDNYGTITIDGGVYSTTTTLSTPAFYNNANQGVIIMNGGTINSVNAGIYNEAGCSFTMNGGVINSTSSYKKTSNYYSYAVRNLPGSACTMNDGTINAVHGGIAAYGDGVNLTTVVVNGGTITTHHSELGGDGFYPLYVSGNYTSMTVNGGTFSGPRTAAMIDDDDIGLTENTVLTITGGTFIAPSGVAAVTRGQNNSCPAISGGYFSSQVPAEFCAEGYAAEVTPNASGYYTVGIPHDGANITVADEISQNFYLDDSYYGEDAYVAIEYNHNANAGETPDVDIDVMALSSLPAFDDSTSTYDGNRVVSITQAPAQITEEIVINVYASQADAEAGKNAVKTITYSAYDYCTAIIGKTNAELGEKATELKELAKTTLDYAAAAQDLFNYNTDDLATQGNGNEFYNAEAIDNVDFDGVGGIAKPSSITNATFVVKSDLEINLLSTTPINVTGASLDTDKGGTRFGATSYQNGDYYVVHIEGIEPANMDNEITVYTDEGNIYLTANAMMRIMANAGNAKLTTLAKTMYLYGAAANAYFA